MVGSEVSVTASPMSIRSVVSGGVMGSSAATAEAGAVRAPSPAMPAAADASGAAVA
ncbi:hypothetical protein D3C85_630470 [compost metagenome]